MPKKELGQYFTKSEVWLKPQVKNFIKETLPKTNQKIFDPFAGAGDLLEACKKEFGVTDILGMDIDPKHGWQINDSLNHIPKTDRLIITNPPYLGKSSATYNGYENAARYFRNNKYLNLYQLALNRILINHDYCVAIIPERYLNQNLFRERIESITILEENPFSDTAFPCCVVCFVPFSEGIKIYKNDKFVNFYNELKKLEISDPQNIIPLEFNNPTGEIGVLGIDRSYEKMKFCKPHELDYPLEKINKDSRLITIVKLPEKLADEAIDTIINRSNEILNEYRKQTADVLLSPFKKNDPKGERKRQLPMQKARAILEMAIKEAC